MLRHFISFCLIYIKLRQFKENRSVRIVGFQEEMLSGYLEISIYISGSVLMEQKVIWWLFQALLECGYFLPRHQITKGKKIGFVQG